MWTERAWKKWWRKPIAYYRDYAAHCSTGATGLATFDGFGFQNPAEVSAAWAFPM